MKFSVIELNIRFVFVTNSIVKKCIVYLGFKTNARMKMWFSVFKTPQGGLDYAWY